MRWKLLRRRFSIAPTKVIVRSWVPWPLRWAAFALMLGLSAAIALWAFEFGKDIAGIDRDARAGVKQLRDEVEKLREERDKAQTVVNSSGSVLKAERTTQDRLAEQVRQLEAANMGLKEDLGFFQRLLPSVGKSDSPVALRGFQAQIESVGQVRFQLLVMQNGGRPATAFSGRYEVALVGTLAGKPWRLAPPEGTKPLQVKPYARVEGRLQYPAQAVVKTVQVTITDPSGTVRATETVHL